MGMVVRADDSDLKNQNHNRDGKERLARIAYLLRSSGFAEVVFWRHFMNRGLMVVLRMVYIQKNEKRSQIEL